MAAPRLFAPLRLRQLVLPNRIVIAPMCQYSARDGQMTDWHLIHVGQLAQSGSGLLIVEATAVEPRGRITHRCAGLYDDASEAAMARVVHAANKHGNTPIAIQLGHAGRKASTHPPHHGGRPLSADEQPWETIAPSAIPFGDDGWHCPAEMDRAMMDDVIAAHVQAVERSARIGFAAVELHGAHGYLVSQFLSPVSNRRRDGYGGGIQQRMRFPLELFEAMRAAWPADKPMGVRLNGTDYDSCGILLSEAVAFAQELKGLGCDFFDVSGGGNSMSRPSSLAPGYQVPLAAAVKQATGMPTMAVGMIRDPALAEGLIVSGQCDMVALARGFLYEPRWSWRAAKELGVQGAYPEQYMRGEPRLWPQAFPEMEDEAQPLVAGSAPHIVVPPKAG